MFLINLGLDRQILGVRMGLNEPMAPSDVGAEPRCRLKRQLLASKVAFGYASQF